jgi:hypothetical protein
VYLSKEEILKRFDGVLLKVFDKSVESIFPGKVRRYLMFKIQEEMGEEFVKVQEKKSNHLTILVC